MAAVLATSLVLAACDSGPDVEPIEPPENAAEPEPGPEPAEEPEDDVPEIFQGQLYPPLPDLEPDERGGDLAIQGAVFAVHQEFYDLVELGLAVNDVDEERLRELAGPDVVDLILSELSSQLDSGEVSLGPDARTGWVRATVFDQDETVVVQCQEFGPRSGAYDAASGEPVDLIGEERTLVRTVNYRLEGTWTATSLQLQRVDAPCEEVPGA